MQRRNMQRTDLLTSLLFQSPLRMSLCTSVRCFKTFSVMAFRKFLSQNIFPIVDDPKLSRRDVTHDLLFLGLISQARIPQRPSSLLQPIQRFLHPFDILQPELRLNNLHIPHRVHISFDVRDLRIVKSAHDLEDSIYRTDV